MEEKRKNALEVEEEAKKTLETRTEEESRRALILLSTFSGRLRPSAPSESVFITLCIIIKMQMTVRAKSSRNFMRFGSHLHLQSAMEYLMTYGWAILIIAVVLGSLFQLGIFNSSNLAPRAQPGSCKVFRPNGPKSNNFINLEGVCSGQMPQYIAQLSGGSGYITAATQGFPSNSFTVSFWVDPYAALSQYSNFMYLTSYGACTSSGSWSFRSIYGANPPYSMLFTMPSASGACDTAFGSCQLNTWYHVAVSFDAPSQTETDYVNGVQASSHPTGVITPTVPTTLNIKTANFGLSNIQIYNASFDASQVQSLYTEGIGGAPISLPYLVGWWPLNGDAIDYSGNNNNGVPTSITYSNTWVSGYTPT